MDCLQFLKKLPDESVNMVMTSPPYWGLRDYGVKGQIGLETDFRDYIRKIVEVFHEVKRVLKKDGGLWLNLGDTYSQSGGAGGQYDRWHSKSRIDGLKKYEGHKVDGIPNKCLLGIPWRIALKMIDDGWILRNCIIWHKPNHMPASVRDRLTNAYEFIFFFVKSKKYYFDLDAIREPHKTESGSFQTNIMKQSSYQGKFALLKTNPETYGSPRARSQRVNVQQTERERKLVDFFNSKGSGGNPGHGIQGSTLGSTHNIGKNPGDVIKWNDVPGQKIQSIAEHSGYFGKNGKLLVNIVGKNPGDFWRINTKPFKGAHFAVFPEELCVKPIVSSSRVGDVVLDPFIGSGTTAVVAKKSGRRFLGCDISPEYVEMAMRRIETLYN